MKGQIPCVVCVVTFLAVGVQVSGLAGGAGVTGINIEQSNTQRVIEQALRKERDLRRLEVSVVSTEATLVGLVPHFFAKHEAIRIVLAVDGIETVVSEIELPEPVDDADIAEELARVILGYPHYTLWDYLDAWTNQGVVTLLGSVTPDRDKKYELYRDITRIPGVQDYVDRVEILSPSSSDRRLRTNISYAIGRSSHFDRYRNSVNFPFHIVINNGVVTLKGYVRSQIEHIAMESIVVCVENQFVVCRACCASRTSSKYCGLSARCAL